MTELMIKGCVFCVITMQYDMFDELFKICHSDEFIELECDAGTRCKILKSEIVGYTELNEVNV